LLDQRIDPRKEETGGRRPAVDALAAGPTRPILRYAAVSTHSV